VLSAVVSENTIAFQSNMNAMLANVQIQLRTVVTEDRLITHPSPLL
jgi:hypothetical protein